LNQAAFAQAENVGQEIEQREYEYHTKNAEINKGYREERDTDYLAS